MNFNTFNLLTWDKRILTPKGAKKFFLACKERLQFGICTHDTTSLRDYLGQIMVIGLTYYANNLHSLPHQWVGRDEEYKDAMMKTAAQQQDCINQAFERIAEIFMDMWD